MSTTPIALKMDITSDAYAANQQGGGAFKRTPKKVKKRTSVKSKKRSRSKKRKIVKKKIRRAPAHNFNGSYSVRMELTSNSTKGLCRSGSKKFRIVNNSTTLKTWALGDTIGGKVSGRRLILFGLKSGVLSDAGNPWIWKGSVTLPKARGGVGTGSLVGGANGRNCVWTVKIQLL